MGGKGDTRRRVLVLGCDARSFLCSLRSLARAGFEVHAAWHEAHGPAFASRHLAAFHPLPKFDGCTQRWSPALFELLAREDFDLVLPTNDSAVIALDACRAELARFRGVLLPAPRVIDVAFDKLATHELARELGIPVPRQRCVRTSAEARDLFLELGAPLYLKPRRSFAFERRKGEHQVRRVFDPAELEAGLAALLETGAVLAQEDVGGRGVGVELLAQRGECLLAFQHRRLHEPPHGGGSSYRASVALDPRLLAAACALARALGLDGPAMFEFRCRADGSFHLIEINARLWGSLPLAVAAGADFPAAWARLALDGERPREPRPGIRRYARNLPMDFGWFLRNLAADRRDPRLLTVPLPRLLAEIGHVLTGRERIDSLALDDPAPFLRELRDVTHDALALLGSRAARLAGELARGRSRARLLQQLARARSVLFVCTGNLCRSAFAEHAARALLPPGLELSSAGIRAEEGRSSPAEMQRCAAEHGVELSAHRARRLRPEDLRAADLILVFDREQRRALRGLDAAALSRTHLVGALDRAGALEIADPYGREYGAFRACCSAIARALGAGARDVRA
jgi:protein-tyrosine-phosphatase/predicted ATP-grasp superfamily ATP-dependent carboligase